MFEQAMAENDDDPGMAFSMNHAPEEDYYNIDDLPENDDDPTTSPDSPRSAPESPKKKKKPREKTEKNEIPEHLVADRKSFAAWICKNKDSKNIGAAFDGVPSSKAEKWLAMIDEMIGINQTPDAFRIMPILKEFPSSCHKLINRDTYPPIRYKLLKYILKTHGAELLNYDGTEPENGKSKDVGRPSLSSSSSSSSSKKKVIVVPDTDEDNDDSDNEDVDEDDEEASSPKTKKPRLSPSAREREKKREEAEKAEQKLVAKNIKKFQADKAEADKKSREADKKKKEKEKEADAKKIKAFAIAEKERLKYGPKRKTPPQKDASLEPLPIGHHAPPPPPHHRRSPFRLSEGRQHRLNEALKIEEQDEKNPQYDKMSMDRLERKALFSNSDFLLETIHTKEEWLDNVYNNLTVIYWYKVEKYNQIIQEFMKASELDPREVAQLEAGERESILNRRKALKGLSTARDLVLSRLQQMGLHVGDGDRKARSSREPDRNHGDPNESKKATYIRERIQPDLVSAITDRKSGIDTMSGKSREAIKMQLLKMIYALGRSPYRWSSDSFYNNIVITGSSGTGKTTLARIIAFVLGRMGVVMHTKLQEITKGALVSSVVNASGPKTQATLLSMLETVVFLDEAHLLAAKCSRYFGDDDVKDEKGERLGGASTSASASRDSTKKLALAPSRHLPIRFFNQTVRRLNYRSGGQSYRSGGQSYRMGGDGSVVDGGEEATHQIMIMFDKYRGLFILIVAGYKKAMICALTEVDSGFRRRFGWEIDIGRFSIEELKSQLIDKLALMRMDIDPESDKRILDAITVGSGANLFSKQGGDIALLAQYFNRAATENLWNWRQLNNRPAIISIAFRSFAMYKGKGPELESGLFRI
jgi:ATPase family associated with various cellular activities (AAA)